MSSRGINRSASNSCGGPTARFDELAGIIRAYRLLCQSHATKELEDFAAELSVEAAVERAASACKPDGRRFDHQRRLSKATLAEVGATLKAEDVLLSRDFDDLYSRVKARIGTIPGVGELMVYDTALRIAARLGLEPTKIYLHRGTREGARALGLRWEKEALKISEVPAAFHVLKPREIEDVLCIFKDRLCWGARDQVPCVS